MNKVKQFFKRAKSFPQYKSKKYIKTEEDIMILVKLRAEFCEACEEMIFQTLKNCNGCGERVICSFCYNEGNTICKPCDNELMAKYDMIEKAINEHKKYLESQIKSDDDIEDFVDQLL